MKIGDTFTDGQKQTWAVGECLGRGSWGRTFLVRPAGGDPHATRVLKVALGPGDFPSDAPVPREVPEACHEALMEQARLLERAEHAFLPRLESVVTLPDGRPALLMARYPTTLQRRLEGAMPLSQALKLVVHLTEQLARAGLVHGALRPSNVLLNERGEPVLTDWLTPAAARLVDRLEVLAEGRISWRPPEAGRPSGLWDTWALCQVLWHSAMTRDAEASQRLELPDEGLDKVALATLKDRALARLGHEQTNPRFRARLTERLAAVLNRGLSRPAEPSPPYRFVDAATLLPRVQEVAALVEPRVDEVGRVLLGPDADANGVFSGGTSVDFTVSVACSAGVIDPDDVVCGLQLTDLDAPGEPRVRLPDAGFRVSTHPSGRLRFRFTLPDVPPGRYRVRTAFSVRDSGHEPQVADGAFEVRPPPGYVPPVERDEPVSKAPLAFPGQHRPTDPPDREPQAPARREEASVDPVPAAPVDDSGSPDRSGPRIHAPVDTAVHEPAEEPEATVPAIHPVADPFSDPGGEIIEGLFPRPIAPPDEHETQVAARPVAPPRVEATVATGQGASFATPATAVTEATAPWIPPTAATPRGTPTAGVRVAPPSISMPLPPGPGSPAAASQPEGHGSPSHEGFDWSTDFADWNDASGDGGEFGIHSDALPPGGGEDLPSWRRPELPFDPNAIPGVARLLQFAKQDAFTFQVAAAAGCLVFVLFVMALVRAC